MESLAQFKPVLKFVLSTNKSIDLTWFWEVDVDPKKVMYKIQMLDKLDGWVTVYWGNETSTTVTNLAPETSCKFRLGVCLVDDVTNLVWSDVLLTATQETPPRMFYLFHAVDRGGTDEITTFAFQRPRALDAYNKMGETALMRAACRPKPAVVLTLLKHGADPNHPGQFTKTTPLMNACYFGYLDSANILDEHGADWLAKDKIGRTALHYAAENSQIDLIKLALEKKVPVDSADDAGWTPLMRAVILNASVAVIQELLSHGAQLSIKDKNKHTALDLARIQKNDVILQIFEDFKKHGSIE